MLVFMKKKPVEKIKDALKIIGLGALLTIHLIFFFGSMKYATLAIGVVCYSLVGFFTVTGTSVLSKSNIRHLIPRFFRVS